MRGFGSLPCDIGAAEFLIQLKNIYSSPDLPFSGGHPCQATAEDRKKNATGVDGERRRRSKAARTEAFLGKFEPRKGAHVMSTVTTKDGIENMSLVPGRPGHDELVPSRYAQKVGD